MYNIKVKNQILKFKRSLKLLKYLTCFVFNEDMISRRNQGILCTAGLWEMIKEGGKIIYLG